LKREADPYCRIFGDLTWPLPGFFRKPEDWLNSRQSAFVSDWVSKVHSTERWPTQWQLGSLLGSVFLCYIHAYRSTVAHTYKHEYKHTYILWYRSDHACMHACMHAWVHVCMSSVLR
jgi:hypothetical protein